MSELTDALIEQHLKTLKLPAMGREYGQLARQAGADSWTYEDYLRELLDCEIRAREASTTARRLREARFPDLKTLGQIDWDAMAGVRKQQIIELATCQFIERPEDVVIAGPIGTGKSHLAIALVIIITYLANQTTNSPAETRGRSIAVVISVSEQSIRPKRYNRLDVLHEEADLHVLPTRLDPARYYFLDATSELTPDATDAEIAELADRPLRGQF